MCSRFMIDPFSLRFECQQHLLAVAKCTYVRLKVIEDMFPRRISTVNMIIVAMMSSLLPLISGLDVAHTFEADEAVEFRSIPSYVW